MKFKVLLFSTLFLLMQVSFISHAKSYNYKYKTPKYGSNYGRTHTVRPYLKKNGTYVQRHRAGNPRSGVHCHNNICY